MSKFTLNPQLPFAMKPLLRRTLYSLTTLVIVTAIAATMLLPLTTAETKSSTQVSQANNLASKGYGITLIVPDYLELNVDDDQRSTDANYEQWDKDHDPSVKHVDTPTSQQELDDDELKTVTITGTAGSAGGVMSLFVISGGDKINYKFWDDGKKNTLGFSGYQFWTVSPNSSRTETFYIEGYNNSDNENDVKFVAGITSGADSLTVNKETTVYQVDLDVDSNNNEGYAFAERSPEEDKIENSANKPGKIIAVSIDQDTDEDGILDFQNDVDGHSFTLLGKSPRQFTPIIVTLPEPFDRYTATCKFTYDEAILGSGHAMSGLRIWKLDAFAPRKIARDLIKSGSSIKWADLAGIVSGQILYGEHRQVTLYLEVINAPGNTISDKKTISVSTEQQKNIIVKDSVTISIVPIDIDTVTSNQISGNDANNLPSAFYGDHPNNPMLMATTTGANAELVIQTRSPSINGYSVFVGVRQVGESTIINSVAAVANLGKVTLPFTALSGTKTYEIVAGCDADGSTTLDNREVAMVFRKTPKTNNPLTTGGAYVKNSWHLVDKIRVVTYDDFVAARASTECYSEGNTIETLYPTASHFIKAFARGANTIPDSSPTEFGILLDASTIPSPEGLGHPLGGKWDSANQTTTHRLVLPTGSDLSEDVVGSQGLREMYSRSINKYYNTIAAAATSSWGVATIPVTDDEINFTDSDSNDQVSVALGKCKFAGTLELSVKAIAGGGFEVGALNCYGAMHDLYDFNYGAPKVSIGPVVFVIQRREQKHKQVMRPLPSHHGLKRARFSTPKLNLELDGLIMLDHIYHEVKYNTQR